MPKSKACTTLFQRADILFKAINIKNNLSGEIYGISVVYRRNVFFLFIALRLMQTPVGVMLWPAENI